MCEEVVASEESYVRSLQALMVNYAAPMRDAALQKQLKLAAADVEAIFGSIEVRVRSSHLG